MENQMSFEGFGVSFREKVDASIWLIREWEKRALELDPMGFNLAFSGGKDSICCYKLMQLASVKFTAFYASIPVDPPELKIFIRKNYPDVTWMRGTQHTFQQMIEKKGLPTRKRRWCCEVYKESGGSDKVKVIGVRAAESARRAKQWSPVTKWRSTSEGIALCPILYWSDEMVWWFIKSNGLKYPELYDAPHSFKRLGCIGCPMARNRDEDFRIWPHAEKMWRDGAELHFKRTVENKKKNGGEYATAKRFKNCQEFWDWWMSEQGAGDDKQICLGLY